MIILIIVVLLAATLIYLFGREAGSDNPVVSTAGMLVATVLSAPLALLKSWPFIIPAVVFPFMFFGDDAWPFHLALIALAVAWVWNFACLVGKAKEHIYGKPSE
jgi:hypothetical protein